MACVKSDAVQIVCEQIMNGHDHVEFHRRKTLKLCRTVLLIIEVGFAQELNLYIYMCVCACVCAVCVCGVCVCVVCVCVCVVCVYVCVF